MVPRLGSGRRPIQTSAATRNVAGARAVRSQTFFQRAPRDSSAAIRTPSFGLIANLWWIHHRFFALLDAVEPRLVALNMLLLAAVALVPFPTNLVGAHPTSSASVMPYIAVLLTLVVLQMAISSGRTPSMRGAGRCRPGSFRGCWPAGGRALAAWQPVVALALLPLNGLGDVLLVRRAPAGYRAWG